MTRKQWPGERKKRKREDVMGCIDLPPHVVALGFYFTSCVFINANRSVNSLKNNDHPNVTIWYTVVSHGSWLVGWAMHSKLLVFRAPARLIDTDDESTGDEGGHIPTLSVSSSQKCQSIVPTPAVSTASDTVLSSTSSQVSCDSCPQSSMTVTDTNSRGGHAPAPKVATFPGSQSVVPSSAVPTASDTVLSSTSSQVSCQPWSTSQCINTLTDTNSLGMNLFVVLSCCSCFHPSLIILQVNFVLS